MKYTIFSMGTIFGLWFFGFQHWYINVPLTLMLIFISYDDLKNTFKG